MTTTPLPPGSGKPDGAVKLETGLDKSLSTVSAAKIQKFDWRAHLASHGIEVHPAADVFPGPSEAELPELAEDIRRNGLHVGIALHTPDARQSRKGPTNLSLVDGRSRLAAVARLGDTREDTADLVNFVLFADDNDSWWPDAEGGMKPCAPVRIFYGDQIVPWAFAFSTNVHRRHLAREQKRELIEKRIKAQPEKSDRQIARESGSNRATVGQIRADLERSGDVSIIDTRTDSAGRQQPARKLGDHRRKLGEGELAELRAGRPTEPDLVEPVEIIGDRKDALRKFDEAVDYVWQRHAEVKALPLWQRVQRVRRARDALDVEDGDLLPGERR